MHLRWHASLERQLHRGEHGLFVVVQHEREDLDHLAVPTGLLQQRTLRASEALGQLGERCAVAQRSRLPLQHGQVVAPVVDGLTGGVMASVDDAQVLADDLAFGRDDESVGVDAQAHRPVCVRRRHAVAVALEVHEAGRRDALGVLDEAVEGPGAWHQEGPLLRPHVGDRSAQLAVRDLGPQRGASLLEPIVQRIEGLRTPASVATSGAAHRARSSRPGPFSQPDAGLQNSASKRKWLTIAWKRALMSRSLPRRTLVDGRLHVVVDAATRHPTQHLEGVVVRVEEHLVGLQRVGPEQEGSAVAQLEVRDLQLGALAGDDGPVLAPVELERLASAEGQRHGGAAA